MFERFLGQPRRMFRCGIAAGIALQFICWSFPAQSPGKPIALPARYDEHRFYVQPVTTAGAKLNFFTDSGGGLFIFREAAERLGLSIRNLGGEGDEAFHVAALPAFKAGAAIPLPESREGRLPVWAPPAGDRAANEFDYDGMLGQDWFGGRVWTFDYPGRRLLLRAPGDVPRHDAKHRAPLGFKTDASGKRVLNFPRVQAVIDGETFDLLFDTGATTFLTDAALASLRDSGAAARATSFITASTFEKWRKRHPSWRVIEQAEKTTGEAMIEAPGVSLAGYTVGPVWFTRRKDANFREYMSQFMDKPVEGALGGNAFRYFRITVDYPNAVAIFER
ncbi:MAG: hypothetical protein SF339_23765 [Blastocatellia bacterium]|nr:hypothetical protein [Blastocatellia bacterium]